MNSTRRDFLKLGPLAPFAGVWEGDKGKDESPDDDRATIEHNVFRERIVLEPIGLVENHEQSLYGLRYAKTAWRLGVQESFHEEVGYWLWDADRGEVMRCFMVPRGSTILAGGSCKANASSFSMTAKIGDEGFGVLSNPYLLQKAKCIEYNLNCSIENGIWTYDEDTVLEMADTGNTLHHTDKNVLKKVG